MHVVNGSTLSITNNTLTNKSAMLVFSYSSFVLSSGMLLLENNECQSSYLILASNASIIWEQGSLINFTNNTLQYQSFIFYNSEGIMEFKKSFLLITNNSVTVLSVVLYYEASTLTLSAAKLLFENNKCMYYSTLLLAENSAIRFEMRTLINSTRNELYDTSTLICFTRTSSVSFNMPVVTINESILVMTNNSINKTSNGFLCGRAICVLSGVEFLFKGNECDQRFCTLMGSSYGIMKLEKGSMVNFTHNNIHRLSSIFRIFKAHLYVNESSLSITNNFLDTSYGFWCRYCVSIVLSSVVLLFRENYCETCSFMQIYEITTRFENHSLVTVTHNKMDKNGYFIYSVGVYLVISESSVIVTGNSLIHTQALLYFMNSSLTLSSGKLILENIKCQKRSKLMETIDTSIKMENNFFVKFVDNVMDKCLTFLYNQTSWYMSSDSELQVVGNNGQGILHSINASFGGTVRVANNSRGIFLFSSVVWFSGYLEVEQNTAMSGGGFFVINSDLYLTNRALFSENNAVNGGALSLISSIMHVSPNATVNFTKNYAELLGGAIYISDPRTIYSEVYQYEMTAICSIQVLPDNSTDTCQFFNLNFNHNKADRAGSGIYGGRTSACLPCGKDVCSTCPIPDGADLFHYSGFNDSSDLSNFTSDPTRACFCENGIPDCYKIKNNITVHPGESFNLSLVIVGYGLGTVPGSVIARKSDGRRSVFEKNLLGSESQYSQEIGGIECQDLGYSIVSERDREQMALAVDLQSFVLPVVDIESLLDSLFTEKIDYGSQYLVGHSSIHEEIFYIPVFVDVYLLPCPVGFQLVSGRCVCHKILLENNIDTCFFSSGTGFILKRTPYWIGLPNDTSSSILIHPHCSFDYCQLQDINITAEFPNTQCQYQRPGVLCGSCREGLSMILGSSECKTCSNVYLASIVIFILMGVALVTILTVLNMTMLVGTLNGLIFFANVLQANRTTFLPSATSHATTLIAFLSAFIAWLNLDVGIPMCFFDGLTTYVKTWLQFVFPLYILALVGVMIIASNYSTRVTRLLGTNAVSVLATLVLLSYTKILRILITAFSFTTLTGSQHYHSVVWLADGNTKYFETKHAILFLAALLVLLLFGVPYTVTLTAAPWIQRSRFRFVSSLYNRLKPLFDAYTGPYKDRHRYWTGMLLLVRVVLIVLFSSIANTNTLAGPQLNLLLLSLSSFALFGLTAALKPYKNKLLNGLEIFYLTILFIISSSNLYVSNIGTGTGPHVYIETVFVGISFLVFLGIFVGHVWYRVRKAGTGRRSEPPEREDDEWRHLWQRARVRAEDEDEEREVTISTAGATNTISYEGRKESLVELIAHNAEI